jgi:hypothetical protein
MVDCNNLSSCSWYRNSNWVVLGKTPAQWAAAYSNKFPITLTIKRNNYADSLQGCAWDCKLMAAISSVLLLNRYLEIKLESAGNPSMYSITFYNSTNGPVQISLNDKLLCDSNNVPIWAHHKSNALEIWPALVEKAFAAYCEGLSSIDTAGWPCRDSNTPEFGSGFIDYDGKEDHRLVKYNSAIQEANLSIIYNTQFDPMGYILVPAIAITKAVITNPPTGITNDHAYTIVKKSTTGDLIMRDPKTGNLVSVSQNDFNTNNFSMVQYIT